MASKKGKEKKNRELPCRYIVNENPISRRNGNFVYLNLIERKSTKLRYNVPRRKNNAVNGRVEKVVKRRLQINEKHRPVQASGKDLSFLVLV